MAEFAIINASELGDRMDAGFHILRTKHEKDAAAIEAQMDRSQAIAKAVELLEKLPIRFRRDVNPLVRGSTNRPPDIQAQERAVREYPFLAIAIFQARASDVAEHYREEARKAQETESLFRSIQKDEQS